MGLPTRSVKLNTPCRSGSMPVVMLVHPGAVYGGVVDRSVPVDESPRSAWRFRIVSCTIGASRNARERPSSPSTKTCSYAPPRPLFDIPEALQAFLDLCLFVFGVAGRLGGAHDAAVALTRGRR